LTSHAGTNAIVLGCRDLSLSFGGVTALTEVTVEFQPGRTTLLVGPNGAGKTTLFNALTGTLLPDSGETYLRNEAGRTRRLTWGKGGLASWRIAQLGVARLFQDVRLFKRLSAQENVLCALPRQLGENPLHAIFLPWRVRENERHLRERATDLLRRVGMEEFAGVRAGDLSFGQQKLVALARALGTGAGVLLLDEPMAGIHPDLAANLLITLRRLASEGLTLVIVEHNLDRVADVADQLVLLREGKIVESGPASAILPRVRQELEGWHDSVTRAAGQV
jgi:ABC-type branched-subunit amino acid transport system ATPase component